MTKVVVIQAASFPFEAMKSIDKGSLLTHPLSAKAIAKINIPFFISSQKLNKNNLCTRQKKITH